MKKGLLLIVGVVVFVVASWGQTRARFGNLPYTATTVQPLDKLAISQNDVTKNITAATLFASTVDSIAAHLIRLNLNTDSLRAHLSRIELLEAGGGSGYVHPTGDGYEHVPANGTGNSGKVLTAGAVAGTYTWESTITHHDSLTGIGYKTHDIIDTQLEALSDSVEEAYLYTLTNAANIANKQNTLSNEAGLYSALSDVTQFLEVGDEATLLDGTNWRLFYVDGSGDVTELALGADGTYLGSNGESSIPSWSVPSGSGSTSTVDTLKFGDEDSRIYEFADDKLAIDLGGTFKWYFESNRFGSVAGGGAPKMMAEQATSTNPVYSFDADDNTGVGKAGPDSLSLIAGGVEGIRVEADTVRVDSSLIINGGNLFVSTRDHPFVGIGIKEPSDTKNTLRVYASGNSNIRNESTSGLASNQFVSSDKIWEVGVQSGYMNNNLIIRPASSGTPLFYFSAGGGLGIGGSPNEFLDVAGNILIKDTLKWGDGDTYFYEQADDRIDLNIGSSGRRMVFTDPYIRGRNTNYWALKADGAATSTIPSILPYGPDDVNTGLGWAGADSLSLIAGGAEILNLAGSQITANQEMVIYPTANTGLSLMESDGGNSAINLQSSTNRGILDVKLNGVNKIRLHGNGDSYFNAGNVGIGTDSPGELLDVNGNILISDTLKWGDGDTRLHEKTDDQITIDIAGSNRYIITNDNITAYGTDAFLLRRVTPSSTTPGFAFGADSNTGIGRAGADQLSLIAGGVEISRIDGDRLWLNPDGNIGDTTGIWWGDGNTGIYESSDNTLTYRFGGTDQYESVNGVIQGHATGEAAINFTATTTSPGYTWRNDANSGLGRTNTDEVTLYAGGKEGLHIDALTAPGAVRTWLNPDGATGDTTGLWFGDGNTGIYEGVDNQLWIDIGGSIKHQILSDAWIAGPNVNYPTIWVEQPTSTNPSISPAYTDANTGIGRAGADSLSLIAGGAEIMNLAGSGATINKDLTVDGTITVTQTDTFEVFTFGGGLGGAADTLAFDTDHLYGAFKNEMDTIVVTKMVAVLLGSSPSLTADVQWHATLNSGSATKLNTTAPTITSTTTGDEDTSFDNAEIPPGVMVWMKTPTITTKPTFMSVTVIGYRK